MVCVCVCVCVRVCVRACVRACACVRGVCTLYYPRYRAQINVGVIHWDVTRLPLKTHSVDVVVTDLVRHCLILCG